MQVDHLVISSHLVVFVQRLVQAQLPHLIPLHGPALAGPRRGAGHAAAAGHCKWWVVWWAALVSRRRASSNARTLAQASYNTDGTHRG